MKYKYVLDSYAWVEFFNGTDSGKKVKYLLEEGEVATSIIAIAELADKCSRENRVFEPFIAFIEAHAVIIPLTREIAIQAGNLKKELRVVAKDVSLADAIHFQTARAFSAKFVTGDSAFKNVKEVIFIK